ncbi:MAG: M23 family metallopeptidase [Treponema sp.]|nr:M23 family metallopeptidase [Treponema sp.]
MQKHVLFLYGALLLFCSVSGFSNSVKLDPQYLPLIPRLSSNDDIYTQYCEDVEQNYMHAAAGKSTSRQFYAYKASKKDTLFTIAASCSIPYETIATANSISNIDDDLNGKTLVLPTTAGIFVCKIPVSSIEILIEKKYISVIDERQKEWYTIGGRLFYFLQNERFSSTERAFFLDSALRMPIDHAWLSSAFGMRISPITGNWKFHEGIDLAAPEGTSVYACKGGKVASCRKGDPVYGNFIILQHSSGMTSIYAHLSKILITAGETVISGEKIGLVGQTGEATGPHLHFEIRMNGIATDPGKILPR